MGVTDRDPGDDDRPRDAAWAASVLARPLGPRAPIYPPRHFGSSGSGGSGFELSPGDADAVVSNAWDKAAADLEAHGHAAAVAVRDVIADRLREVRDELEESDGYLAPLHSAARAIEREAKSEGEATRLGDSVGVGGRALRFTTWEPAGESEYALTAVDSGVSVSTGGTRFEVELGDRDAVYAKDATWKEVLSEARDRYAGLDRHGEGARLKAIFHTLLFRRRVLDGVIADYELFGAVLPYAEVDWAPRDTDGSRLAVSYLDLGEFLRGVADVLHGDDSRSLMDAVRVVEARVKRHFPDEDVPYRTTGGERRDDGQMYKAVHKALKKRGLSVQLLKEKGTAALDGSPPRGGGSE